MFSDNQKISLRQTYRLFVFDLLGGSTLLLPTQLAALCGNDGIWCILLGSLLGFAYLFLLGIVIKKMKMDLLSYMEMKMAVWWRKVIQSILIIYSLTFAAFLGYIFVSLVQQTLIPEEAFWSILLLILLVSGYAVSGGMESRARVYELLFLFVIIPLLVMLAVAAKDIEISLFVPIFKAEFSDLLKGTYLVFIAYSVLFYILFFPESVEEEKQKRLIRYIASALGIVAVILCILYVILIGSFGANALSNMRFPVVTLMSTVQIKGGFLKRTDALMLGVWFFTLFALLNLHVYYASKISRRLLQKEGKKKYIFAVLLIIFVITMMFEYGDGMMSRYIKILECMGIPILVLIPVVILLTGCNSTELEDRCFPMMAAIDYNKSGQEVVFAYTFPRAGIKSEAGQEAADIHIAPVKRKDFESARVEYGRELSKKPDVNHLKIVLLGDSFIENSGQYEQMLELLQADESFPRNTYVCVTDDVDGILKQDEHLSTDIGSYLEELVENHDRNTDNKLPTMGNLIDEKDNKRKTLRLPFLEIKSDTVVWDTEYIVEKGIPIGIKK